jgi:hypothetical protein
MGIKLFNFDGNNQFLDASGVPVTLGSVKFFDPDNPSVLKATYPTAAAARAGTPTNPTTISLNSSGRPASGGSEIQIWLNGDYNIQVLDSAGATVRSASNLNPDDASTAAEEDLRNPSFEDALTDTWKVYKSDGTTEGVVSTDYEHESDAADVNHGAKALTLKEGAIAKSYWSGGGALVAHSPDEDISIEFSLICGAATDLAKVTVKQYSAAGADLGADVDIFSSSSGNPTSAELKAGRVAAGSLNASMRYYALVLKGGNGSGQWARFDGIRVVDHIQNAYVNGTLTAKSGVSVGDSANTNKGLTFYPTSASATVPGARCILFVTGTTGSATPATAHGVYSGASVVNAYTTKIDLNRAVDLNKVIAVAAGNGSGASTRQVVVRWVTTSALEVVSYDPTGATQNGVVFSVMIWEFD